MKTTFLSSSRKIGVVAELPEFLCKAKRRKTFFAQCLALIIGVVLALTIGELFVRLVFRRSMDFDMEMWKYANDVKIASDNPDRAHEHRPNRRTSLMGVEVVTNSFGLRGPETTLEKPPGVFRIVVLGDSVTMGWGVLQDQTYPAVLEKMLNKHPPVGWPVNRYYEVLNLGVGNYNTVQEVTTLQEIGLKFNPDLILLGYFINDAEPTPIPKKGFLIEHSYLFAFIVSRLRTLSWGNARIPTYREYYTKLYEPAQPGWLAAQSALAKLAATSSTHKIPSEVFIIPELHDLSLNYPFTEIHNRLKTHCERLGIPVVDLFPYFLNRVPETLWVSSTDAHPNAKGHELIARAIHENLANRVLMSYR